MNVLLVASVLFIVFIESCKLLQFVTSVTRLNFGEFAIRIIIAEITWNSIIL